MTRSLADSGGQRVNLTSAEFDLLMAFVQRPGEPLSRAALMRALKGRNWDYFDRSLYTLVARLRKKIDSNAEPRLIRSVRGVGYVFCAGVSRQYDASGA
jgi:DNA-binding response OmpR family regulator